MNTEDFKDIGFAKLDTGRKLRRGFSEAVFCEYKTKDQLIQIFRTFKDSG
ncbi:MAG: hypothetical protein ACI37R_03720 [Candidatus Avigastranaerophilus sp.]